MEPLIAPQSPLRISMFGPLHVEANGSAIARPSKKALCLLALLGLRAGRLAGRAWLAEQLWPEADPDRGLSNLRQVLTELRKALANQGARLRSEDNNSISLDLEGAWVDVIAFDEHFKAGGREALIEAVVLYKAPLLEDWAEEWVGPERDVRQAQCLNALERLAQLAHDAGDPKSAVKRCREASEIDPHSDSVHRRLMKALEQAGDANAAVQAYHEFTVRLERELGLAPEDATTKVYRRIQQSVRSRDDRPASRTAKESSESILGNIPPRTSDLVGREDDCDEVAVMLRRSRLVTLTGVGGIGKTRLALEVAARSAREYEDGAWLISLSPIADGALITDQIARTLGLSEEAGRGLVEHLKNKRLLLLFDNCEHLLSSVDRIAASLLKYCAGLRILATSRSALGITGEMVLTVPPLAVPTANELQTAIHVGSGGLERFDGVRLYCQRARAADPDFILHETNVALVGTLCSRLEGMPLAIELAAARSAATEPEALERCLGLLLDQRSSKDRGQSLRETLDWSFNLLRDSEQALFRRLSVFVGDWRLDVAETVCSDLGSNRPTIGGDQIVGLLSSLVDSSLVVYADGADAGRYSFLELVREYARESALRSGELDTYEERHLEWAVELAETAAEHIRTAGQTEWLRRLDVEYDNIRAAIERSVSDGNSEAAFRICEAMTRFWLSRNSVGEGRRLVARALEINDGLADARWRASGLSAAASLAGQQGDYEQAAEYGHECLAIREHLGDTRGIARAARNVAHVAHALGDYPTARKLYTRARNAFEELGMDGAATTDIGYLGIVTASEGELDTGRALIELARNRFQEIGEEQSVGWLGSSLASIAADQGNLEMAAEMFGESILVSERQNDLHRHSAALGGQAIVEYYRGNVTAAKDLAERSLSLCRDLGSRREVAERLVTLGQISGLAGEFSYADGCFQEALSLSREIRDRTPEMDCLAAMGHLALLGGDFGAAKRWAMESLAICHQIQRKLVVAANLETLAAAEARAGSPSAAVGLWATAETLRRAMGAPLPPIARKSYEAGLAEARRHLGQAAFDAIWLKGEERPWTEAEEASRLELI